MKTGRMNGVISLIHSFPVRMCSWGRTCLPGCLPRDLLKATASYISFYSLFLRTLTLPCLLLHYVTIPLSKNTPICTIRGTPHDSLCKPQNPGCAVAPYRDLKCRALRGRNGESFLRANLPTTEE